MIYCQYIHKMRQLTWTIDLAILADGCGSADQSAVDKTVSGMVEPRRWARRVRRCIGAEDWQLASQTLVIRWITQEAQPSQTDRVIIRVIEYFAGHSRLLKIIRNGINHSKAWVRFPISIISELKRDIGRKSRFCRTPVAFAPPPR